MLSISICTHANRRFGIIPALALGIWLHNQTYIVTCPQPDLSSNPTLWYDWFWHDLVWIVWADWTGCHSNQKAKYLTYAQKLVGSQFRLPHDIKMRSMIWWWWWWWLWWCMKDNKWEILEVSRGRVDQFRRTVPLITDLKNSAMRQRHWDQVQVTYLLTYFLLIAAQVGWLEL